MIRAVVWKELREQGPIAVVLAVLGGGLLVATAMLADPPVPGAPPTDVVRALGASGLVTLMLVVTAGMVCGGALFAAEQEAGTMPFLLALPARRGALWRAKLVAGLALASVQVGLLVATAVILDVADFAFVRRLMLYGLLAFAWGTLGSVLARTTLGSVGIAIPAATLATFVFLVPISLLFVAPGASVPRPNGWILYGLLMLVVPLGLSLWRFTAPDRARAAYAPAAPAQGWSGPRPRQAPAPRGGGFGGRALVWLAVRQLRGPGAVMSAFALAFGTALLLPDMHPGLLWPVLALAGGALTGVLAFGDEQGNRSAPFWTERRLPVGRAWWVKIGAGLALLAWLLVVLAFPSLLRAQFESAGQFRQTRTTLSGVFQTRLFDELGPQSWKYLLAPAAYGFAVGHLSGLLFRKLVVACGVAMMVGGAAAALWVPSLLAGGVSHWQVWIPPALVLLTGRLLVRAWAADRLTDRGPVLRAVGGGCLALLVLAAGIGYRVVQVPDDPNGEADLKFVADQPPYDENLGGREFRAAVERFARVAAAAEVPPMPTTSGGLPAVGATRLPDSLEKALRFGWPDGEPALGEWLDRVFSEPLTVPGEKSWPDMAAAAAERPIGIFESPTLVSSAAATAAVLDNARRMSQALLARGLQRQAAGHPEEFLTAYRTVIALARNLRNGSGVFALSAGIEVERRAVVAAERWLERLGPGSALPRQLARAAAAGDDPAPFDPRPYGLADRYVTRGLMQAPAAMLAPALVPPGGNLDRSVPEAELVAFAWSVPWERERTRRLVGLTPDGLDRTRMFALVVGRPAAALLLGRHRSTSDLTDSETLLRVGRRALILKAAVRAFQADRGTVPRTLNELVAGGYLAYLPADPYADGHPFGYRVSTGETLRSPARAGAAGAPPGGRGAEDVIVPPGQAILWSVGPDGADQGGRVAPGGAGAEDLVFLVPLPVR